MEKCNFRLGRADRAVLPVPISSWQESFFVPKIIRTLSISVDLCQGGGARPRYGNWCLPCLTVNIVALLNMTIFARAKSLRVYRGPATVYRYIMQHLAYGEYFNFRRNYCNFESIVYFLLYLRFCIHSFFNSVLGNTNKWYKYFFIMEITLFSLSLSLSLYSVSHSLLE